MAHLVLSALVLFTASIGHAETDLNKALVGTWQGEIKTFRVEPYRTLIVTAVTQKDGQWTAHGLYAITGKDG